MKLENILNNDQILLLENMNMNIVMLLEAELQQADDEPHPDDIDAQNAQDPNAQPAQDSQDASQQQNAQIDPNTGQPIPTPEEQLAYELEGAEDKFIQMVLYERLMELDTKLELLQISVQDGVGVSAKYFYDKISQYKQYVEILNELIFSISTSTIYKLVGQIELELIDLLNEYTLAYHDNLVYDEAREANK